MQYFKRVAVFAVIGLTTTNPLPQESIFSDLSDLSTNSYNSDAGPLGDSNLLESSDEWLDTVDLATFDDSDGSFFFPQDFSIADDFCSAPNDPVRKRDNMKCDSSPSKSPSINIPLLPNPVKSGISWIIQK